jgi:hypothetical protein
MSNWAIFILSRGRAGRQITIQNLPRLLLRHTYLVVEDNEVGDYGQWEKYVKDIIPFPEDWGRWQIEGYGNFSDKKQFTAEWCMERGIRYMLLMDDDLKFDVRRDGKLKPAFRLDTYKGVQLLLKWMIRDKYAHVAMSPREGNNWEENDYQIAGRAMRVCGFDLKVVKKHKLKFDRTRLMADFDITLQLLELGYPNKLTYVYANGQRKSNDDGGCSLYRTPERMKEAAEDLHHFHPKFVTVKKKKTSKPWAGFDTNVRYDVQVSWKKAYQYGKGQKSGITKFLKK